MKLRRIASELEKEEKGAQMAHLKELKEIAEKFQREVRGKTVAAPTGVKIELPA
jgi:hypothetical protein